MPPLSSVSARLTPIGLDVGSGGVRAAQLRRSGDDWTVVHIAHCERPITDGEEERSDVERQILTCLGQAEFSGRRASVALSAPDVEFHALDLPAAILTQSDESASRVVRSEVLRLTNKPDDQIETGHWSLPPTKVTGPTVIGAAVDHEAIDQMLRVCERTRLQCMRIDTAATSLCRLGCLLNMWEPSQLWGILDIGQRQARLTLCLDDVPVLVRTTGAGGRAWTEWIAESLEISVKAAEIQKREHGLAPPRGNMGRRVEDTPAAEVRSILGSILRGNLKDLAGEIQRSYEYVLSCYPSHKAGDLILVGGAAALKNLPELLADALGIPVRMASSYLASDTCRLRHASSKQNPLEVFGLAVGLAVGD